MRNEMASNFLGALHWKGGSDLTKKQNVRFKGLDVELHYEDPDVLP